MKASFFLIILLLSSASVLAKKGNSVSHHHGSRVHSHPLPNSGKNHSHNKNKNKKANRQKWSLLAKASNKDGSADLYEGKIGSFEFSETKGGDRMGVIIVRLKNTKSPLIDLQQKYVTLTDCKRGMGIIYTLNMRGKYEYKNDFVIDGGTIASSIAGEICYIVNKRQRNQRKYDRVR